jgi:hypothetical protein
MKKEFDFFGQPYTLEMDGDAEAEGDFRLFKAVVTRTGATRKGVFKLTKSAWEAVNRKAEKVQRPLDENLVEGCIDAIKAELYIRPLPDEFSYLLDHRYFEKPLGWE